MTETGSVASGQWLELTRIFNEVFERDDLVLDPQQRCADIKGWDSFRLVQIVIRAQETFGVALSPDEIDSIRRIGDIAALLERHLPTLTRDP